MNTESLAQIMALKKVSKGKVVFEFGQPLEHFYMLISGEIILKIPNPMVENW